MAKVLVLYYSRTGNVRKMAEAVAQGARDGGAEVDLLTPDQCAVDALLEYDGIIVGSPTYYGVIAGPIKDFFDRSVVHHGKLEGKVGAAFSSAGVLGGGCETTVLSILQMMLVHGMIVQGRAGGGGGHYGVVCIGTPDEKTLAQCRDLGARVAQLVNKIFG